MELLIRERRAAFGLAASIPFRACTKRASRGRGKGRQSRDGNCFAPAHNLMGKTYRRKRAEKKGGGGRKKEEGGEKGRRGERKEGGREERREVGGGERREERGGMGINRRGRFWRDICRGDRPSGSRGLLPVWQGGSLPAR